jgi:DMATS type aromatic prenyltransferase
MLHLAGYTLHSSTTQLQFFSAHVSKSLEPYPRQQHSQDSWKSFLTDDHTPIELSWNWSPLRKTPSVRYSVDPIPSLVHGGPISFNTKASKDLLESAIPFAPGFSTELYQYMTNKLTVLQHEVGQTQVETSRIPRSQQILAFDLEGESVMPKVYFLPQWKAFKEGTSTLQIMDSVIGDLPNFDSYIRNGWKMISDYISSRAKDKPEVEFVAIDCVDPLRSRIKIYLRSQDTRFASVLDMMTLRGRLPSISDKSDASLRRLWRYVLDLDTVEESVPVVSHTTAGILYYMELRFGRTYPRSKLYIPVKHYGKNDLVVARGLSRFLEEEEGKGFADGVT